jgi:hypothetical protein
MKLLQLTALSVAILSFSAINLQAQYLYKFVFKGMCWQSDTNGNIVNIPFTDQTIINEQAAGLGLDPSSLTLVYHIGADPHGDNVDIVRSSDGAFILHEFLFWFGDESSFNRMALTNATGTDIRRNDQLFTQNNSPHTCDNSHGMGTVYTSKKIIGVTNGIPYYKIEGTLQWVVNPVNGASSKTCYGTFTATQVMF